MVFNILNSRKNDANDTTLEPFISQKLTKIDGRESIAYQTREGSFKEPFVKYE